MQQQISKTLIGGFVVGALMLLFAGVMIFGSGKFFEKKVKYVLYFQESIKGLNVGAPVVFKGVRIGSVTDILLIADAEDLTFQIPIYIKVERDSFQIKRGKFAEKTQENINRLIERGLRAQLQAQSMVTGQLMIELDYHPDTPVSLMNIKGEPPEIPTIPSTMESIVQTIKDLNLEELTQNLTSAVAGLDRIINSPDVTESINALHKTIDDTGRLIRHLDGELGPLAVNMNETIKDAQKLIDNVNAQVNPLSDNISETAKAVTDTLEHATKTLETVEDVLAKDSATMYQANQSLKELSDAARSIRVWAEYMERHPEALIRGKK